MNKPQISIIIPVHNEEKILRENLEKISGYMESLGKKFEIVLIENGSSDSTREIAEAIARRDKRVRALSIPQKDLGGALKRGILNAKGEYLIWYPIDLSVELDYIPESLQEIEDYDIIIGSKTIKGSIDNRPFGRKIYSILYNSLVNLLFNLRISDTQCVKTFSGSSIVPMVEETKSGGIVFEVELLYKARKSRLKIKEIPVRVKDTRLDSKINFGVIRKAFQDLISLRVRI